MCTWIASHLSSLPMATCFGKSHYHSLLMSEAHALETFLVAMGTMPCPILSPSFLSATRSHDIAPMTPHLCTRHWALASCLDSASLLLHPSNKPWHYAHGSSRRLAQGIAPLCHCREGSLHHTSCHCGHGLHTTTHCGAYMWVSTRLAPCSLLVLEALHRGPLLWLHPCHLVSPWVTYPLLPSKSISGHFLCFWKRHHIYLKMNNGFIE